MTLNIHEKTEKTATLSVKPDVESAKDALITFVGNYNQAVTQINLLSQTKPEIVEEITYLSEEEKESEMKKLGMFTSDSSLTSLKSSLQNTVLSKYNFLLFIILFKIFFNNYFSPLSRTPIPHGL